MTFLMTIHNQNYYPIKEFKKSIYVNYIYILIFIARYFMYSL